MRDEEGSLDAEKLSLLQVGIRHLVPGLERRRITIMRC